MKKQQLNRRQFLATSGLATGALLATPAYAMTNRNKRKLALVGTGIRGTSFWGKRILEQYADLVEFVGLCDINPGRLDFGKSYIGADCPVFTDFDLMMTTVKPDLLIVTTVDATHHEFIIKGLDLGCDVLTEKPLTTDEIKCQGILDAERRSGKKLIMGFNYRWAPHFTKLKELLAVERVGKLTSVDFHWYLNVYHGASYFRRWHGLRDMGGTLLVHKATHHFDLLNWWIDSDPVEVVAHGELEHYGHNNPFRSGKCRGCPHKDKCKFYWDITNDKMAMKLYVENEHYDGYIRDRCLWNEDIDIYDKMAVQIKYANDVQVSYSLTTYSPYEGWRVAFNGFTGRIDSWQDIPWRREEKVNQAELHAQEMSQKAEKEFSDYDEVMVMDNFSDYEKIRVPRGGGGHGGGDRRLQDKIFRNPGMADPYQHAAGSRDGAMSVLIGIAARKSIEENRMVRIEELTDLQPAAMRNT
ncbi:MAG: Gfo/Idh/MocA family oxidoreductase [Bacteroidales bacterium]|nr:Gfo/Idh/MocA family oxidoreductase [Bacteroidales bacterium]MDT8431255.1 Gfo/Idh/MocA family oxidoreductase [Bacteroidales bacterium]